MSKELTTQKNKVGRPTVITEQVLAKLEHAFAVGATDRMACFYAGISQDALYDYQDKNPKFSERKAALKEKPVLQALNTVSKALSEGDVNTAKWYLEKKRKSEFGNAIDVTSGGEALKPGLQAAQTNIQIIAAEVAEKLKAEKITGKPNEPSSE